ncbi:MAG: putative Histidine kinase [Promethearchaeota archaeon]|nr:MAG: putative Histidine kinase [Candidatus Lokiarchaeota archaeon]
MDSLLFFQIILLIAFFIGLCLSIQRYRKKKNIFRIILIFLFFQGFSYLLAIVLTPYSEIFQIIPFLSALAILIFVGGLIAFNIRLEKKIERTTKDTEDLEQKYRNLVLNIVDVIFELDKNLDISYISPQVYDLFHYNPSEMISYNITKFIYPDDLMEIKKGFSRNSEKEAPLFMECRMVSKKGGAIDVSIRGSIVKNEEEYSIIGVIRDISNQKKVEKILRKEYERLKEINAIRSDLIRRTSHELKTPLISLFSSTQYILDTYKDKLDNELLKYIQIINRGGKRLKDLTSNLLDAYNIESTGLKLTKKRVNLTESIKNCITDLIFSFEERKLYLKEDLEEHVIVEIDQSRIEQVILNLLSNAIKNNVPKGLILVKLEQKNDKVRFIIRDTGIGLTEHEKSRLFKKFGKIERNGEQAKIITEGSGLGLYLSKEIIELHGGTIRAESEGRNKGAAFIVELPI